MKKTWILLLMTTIGLALFTSCASNADTLPSPSPSASATPMITPTVSAGPTASMAPEVSGTPEASMMPDIGLPANGMNGSGVNSVEDAERVSDSVTDEVEKLSELDDAEAVVAGSIALVGVQYDAQYQGGLTDRLVEMVKERVDMVDKSITTVHVTDDAELFKRIAQLREKLDDKQITFEELQTQVLDIGSNIAGGGEAKVTRPKTDTGA